MREMELWGGHECSLNRVGSVFRDQTELSGHGVREGDLDLFASLGLAALRYPLLWERVAPDRPDRMDWRWADARLTRLRALAIRPILGLVHHGSGPAYTDLLADDFASGLAQFASAAAARFDWVEEWTPVNEPLTTARFSALYGLWYPHARDERSFWRALLNQIDGIRLAMRAIRRVVPHGRLIQTEDLGRTWATAPLRDQAGFDNSRRWMTWDLLCGRVTRDHALWKRIGAFGLEDRLRAIADDPCPPEVIGVNHYLTSDRFLDHRFRHYPAHTRGGNADRRFADVEAIRVLDPPSGGLGGALRETWQRYGIPLAATEIHNGCTREEQMRWFADAWQEARRLRGEGVAVEAVTSWALLGSQGWNTLLTAEGCYEAGAFDSSGGAPRPTALARSMALRDAALRHPVLAGAGWWRRPGRLHYPTAARPAPMRDHAPAAAGQGAPLLIAGATGSLGRALAAACRRRNIRFLLTDRAALDVTDDRSIAAALDRSRPWAVINATGWVRVDEAEREADACFAINAHGAAALARACGERGIQSATFSSDLVFDGRAGRAYVESDAVAPLGVYGRSKAAAEAAILAIPGEPLIVRTAAFFSPFDRFNMADAAMRAMTEARPWPAARDQIVSPTYVPHLCDAVLDLVIDDARGIWHLSSGQALSWSDFARRVARRCGLDGALVRPVDGASLELAAARPPSAALASQRGRLMPDLDVALTAFAADWNVSR